MFPFVGPKTVFFWAPVCKWGLVMAGMADMTRPADKLSLSQSGVLMVTGNGHCGERQYLTFTSTIQQ
uniref:Mitochondrial pyruvate carrier n=1 Tax=Hucho hucho TaxID=62062 RepID=A0A4W5LZ05_9TELE